ncbi:hypothetical protein ES702_02010 [subsurface metagenome]
MLTISTRVSDEKAAIIKDYCFTKGMSLAQLVESALDALLEGKIDVKKRAPRLAMRERIPLCPECDYLLYYAASKEEGPYVFCLNCGFWGKVQVPLDKWHEGEFRL